MGELIGNIWQKICSEEEKIYANGQSTGIFSSLFFKNPRILNFEICCIKKLLTAFSFTGFKIAKTAIKMVNAFIPKPSITKDITPSI